MLYTEMLERLAKFGVKALLYNVVTSAVFIVTHNK